MTEATYEIASLAVNGLSVAVLALSIFIAAKTQWKSSQALRRSDRFNKRADVIMHCNQRYDELYKSRISMIESSINDESLPHLYYSRFWGLQSDQFDYWLADLIDIETFSSWWYNIVAKSIDKHVPAPGAPDIVSSWVNFAELDHRDANPWFHSFVDEMIHIATTKDRTIAIRDRILDVIERYETETSEFRKKLDNSMSLRYYRQSLSKKI